MQAHLLSGVRRSGIHAIAYWMLAHYGRGLSMLVNDLSDLNSHWLKRPTWRERFCNNVLFDHGEALTLDESNRLMAHEPHYDAILATVEDKSKWFTDTIWRELGFRLAMQNVQQRYVLRSIYNVIASRTAANRRFCCYVEPWMVDVWKEHARQALVQPAIVILYDRWHVDPDYRTAVARSLGLPNPGTASRATIPPIGGGSSFDGTTPGDSLRTNVRWGMIVWDDSLAWVLADDELRAINQEVFGWALDAKGNRIVAR